MDQVLGINPVFLKLIKEAVAANAASIVINGWESSPSNVQFGVHGVLKPADLYVPFKVVENMIPMGGGTGISGRLDLPIANRKVALLAQKRMLALGETIVIRVFAGSPA